MQNGQSMNVPLIGAKRLTPVETFHLQGIGWFTPNQEFTALDVCNVLIILINLMMPHPQEVVFDIPAFVKEKDLEKYFSKDRPKIESKEKLLLNSENNASN